MTTAEKPAHWIDELKEALAWATPGTWSVQMARAPVFTHRELGPLRIIAKLSPFHSIFGPDDGEDRPERDAVAIALLMNRATDLIAAYWEAVRWDAWKRIVQDPALDNWRVEEMAYPETSTPDYHVYTQGNQLVADCGANQAWAEEIACSHNLRSNQDLLIRLLDENGRLRKENERLTGLREQESDALAFYDQRGEEIRKLTAENTNLLLEKRDREQKLEALHATARRAAESPTGDAIAALRAALSLFEGDSWRIEFKETT